MKELIRKHAEKNNTFDECDILREVVEWMNNRVEGLNRDKSMHSLITEYLREVTK